MKKKLLTTLTLSTSLLFPTVVAVSCSNNQQQNEANKIYKEIYDSFQKDNKYGNNTYYANSIYDLNSFNDYTNSNPVRNIQSKSLEISISNLDYSKAGYGELQFDLVLRDKSSKKAILPSPPSNATSDKYFSNSLTISGFKRISSDLLNEVKNVYHSLKETVNRFDFNEKGVQWINDNFQNIEENIDFNNPLSDNYFEKFINVPTIINERGFKIFKFVTNILNKKPINRKNESELIFNFWIILSNKNEPNVPISIPFSLKQYGSNNNKNEIIEIAFSKNIN